MISFEVKLFSHSDCILYLAYVLEVNFGNIDNIKNKEKKIRRLDLMVIKDDFSHYDIVGYKLSSSQ